MTLAAARFRGRTRLEQIAARHVPAYLRQGDSGEDLRVVQVALIDRGYSISDAELGQFGPQTAIEVVRFKTDESLQPNDPVIGMLTMKRLDAYFASETPDHEPRPGALFRIDGSNQAAAVWLTSAHDPVVWRANLGAADEVAELWIEWLTANGYLSQP